MAHRISLKLESGPVTVNVLDWGDAHAKDTVVCAHGLTRNAYDFEQLAVALASSGRRVLSIDIPGRGDSPWLENPLRYGYALYVATCLTVLDNFHLRSVEWVGTSMGGIIGMMIAATMPKRIKKLVLNDIGARISQEGLARIMEYVRTMPRRFADKAEATAYLKQAFEPFGIRDEVMWQAFVDHSLAELPEGGFRLKTDPAIAEPLRVETKDYTQINAVDLGAFWEKVQCPTLLLRGEHSDLLTVETYKAMLSSNFKAQGEEIKGCGHAPSLTTIEQISVVQRFLDGVGALHVSAIGA